MSKRKIVEDGGFFFFFGHLKIVCLKCIVTQAMFGVFDIPTCNIFRWKMKTFVRN